MPTWRAWNRSPGRHRLLQPDHLPQAAIEREPLEVLLSTVLTPANQERLLNAVNSRLRAHVAEARPRIKEIRKALTQVEREIANYTRAVGRGDFTSLETALAGAEQRRATLQAELAHLDGSQQHTVVQLTPAMLERHLQGMTEKLRSGMTGRVREAIQQSLARILVGVDGSLTIEAKPSGLLGVEGIHARLGREGEGGIIQQTLPSSNGRQWKVTIAP